MMSLYLQGFGVCLGLLVAIGAQNAFVLARAVRGEHIAVVAAICIVIDAALILMGVTGVGAVLASSPVITRLATLGAVVFLVVYGAHAARSALRRRSLELHGVHRTASLRATVWATLAVSLLNPHAFLDTFILLAGMSAPLDGSGRLLFSAGAITASTTWFCVLSLVGRALAPWFRKPLTWKLLDAFVCLTMWTLAATIAMTMLL